MDSKRTYDLPTLRNEFERDGFVVLPGYFSSERIDHIRATVAKLLDERADEIVADSIITGKRSTWAEASQRETRHFKFNDLFLLSAEVRETALDPELASILNALLGSPVALCNSLNFEKGSVQGQHIDSLFMTPKTPHALIATWTGLEDVHPDSGPLFYFRGSHKIPLYRFADGSHHANREEMPAWDAYIEKQVAALGLQPEVFMARKGDVLIWHSDLLHGGSPIRDSNRTRASLVFHYYSEADCRRGGGELVPLNGAFWEKRAPQTVPKPGRVWTGEGPFPEQAYLERHADVKAAVLRGDFKSGESHYVAFGRREGRLI